MLLLDSCVELDGLIGLEFKVVDFWGMNFIGFIIGRIGEGFVKRIMDFIYLKVYVVNIDKFFLNRYCSFYCVFYIYCIIYKYIEMF